MILWTAFAFISCIFSITNATESHQSIWGLSEHYPGFDGIDKTILACDSNTKEGSYTFDSGRGIAYFALSNSMFYLEYYAPTLYWTGHSPADQSVDGKHSDCMSCLGQHNNEASKCIDQCIVDHIFLVTGASEDINQWIPLELKINSDLKLPDTKYINEINNEYISKVQVCENGGIGACHQYIHVKYYRNYENRHGDKYELSNGDNRVCFSWITSDPSEGAFVTAVKASTVFNNGVVCVDTKAMDHCETHENIHENIPISPPHFDFVDVDNACKKNDISLVIVMDLSDSINSESMGIGKQWIQHTIDYGKQLLNEHSLLFRTSLITFSSKVELVWNLDADQSHISDKLAAMDRPHDPLIEEGLTFTKDALQTVIDKVLPLKHSETEQLLVVILTDGAPSNEYQNPCSNDNMDISAKLHSQSVRTVVVGIEQGQGFDSAPFGCLYYPYATDKSVIMAENFQHLLGYQIDSFIIETAFPISCDMNSDVNVPSTLFRSTAQTHETIEDIGTEARHSDIQSADSDPELTVHYNAETCMKPEPYQPIRDFVYKDQGKEYKHCEKATTEWRLELVDWKYHNHHDQTEYLYEVCTSHFRPHNHCKLSDSDEEELSKHLKSIALQMPCDCEICIGYGVHDMNPKGNFAQLEKAWIWADLDVEPGKCQQLTMTLMGYAETVNGNYYLEGKDRYESGTVAVPNPCNEGLDKMVYPMPHTPPKDTYPNPDAAKCKDIESFEPYYPKYCKGYCNPMQMEYEIRLAEYKYSHGSDKTVFTYALTTLKPANLPDDFCSYYPYEQPIPLKEIHLSIPCQCQHLLQNGYTLLHATEGMIPQNENNGISENHWHFSDLSVGIGQTKNVSIVLKGMIPFGMGDYTVVGEMERCGYGRHVIKVPDICNSRCLWGQWTKWDTQWERCSKKCGGGITKRTRQCVSVCDGKTPVYNCYGESEEVTPCNTNQCGMPKHYNAKTISQAKYWGAY